MVTPTQAQLLKLYREADKRPKRTHYHVISLGLGAASIAAAIVGLPDMVSYALMGCGVASWLILKWAAKRAA